MTVQKTQSGLIVSGEILPLNKGLYRFSVESAAPRRLGEDGELVLPAIHVGVGPGVPPENIEIMTGLRNDAAWLCEHLDMLVIKVKANPTLVLLTSVRSDNMAPLDVSVERIDSRKQPAQAVALPAAVAPALQGPAPSQVVANMARVSALAEAARKDEQGRAVLRTRTLVHVTNKGDLTFVDAFWAGAMGESLPIEAFSIEPLERVSAQEIEFKGLAANGNETPWMGGGELCGTRGMAMPLAGFAIRLRAPADVDYDCEYRGAFKSGKIVGPISNGAPCRAMSLDDHLVGIQITLAARTKAQDIVQERSQAALNGPSDPGADDRLIGPRFSIFRENAL